MNHFARIAAALEEEGLDAVLLTGEANRFYASGFFTPGSDAAALVWRRRWTLASWSPCPGRWAGCVR